MTQPVASIVVVGTKVAVKLQDSPEGEYQDVLWHLQKLTPREVQAVRVAVFAALHTIEKHILPNLRHRQQ